MTIDSQHPCIPPKVTVFFVMLVIKNCYKFWTSFWILKNFFSLLEFTWWFSTLNLLKLWNCRKFRWCALGVCRIVWHLVVGLLMCFRNLENSLALGCGFVGLYWFLVNSYWLLIEKLCIVSWIIVWSFCGFLLFQIKRKPIRLDPSNLRINRN